MMVRMFRATTTICLMVMLLSLLLISFQSLEAKVYFEEGRTEMEVDQEEISSHSPQLESTNIVIDDMQLTQGVQYSHDNRAIPLNCGDPQSSEHEHIKIVRDYNGTYKPMAIRIVAHSPSTPQKIDVIVNATLTFTRMFKNGNSKTEQVELVATTVAIGSEEVNLSTDEGIVIPVAAQKIEIHKDDTTQPFSDTVTLDITLMDSDNLSNSADCEATYQVIETPTPQIFFHSVKFPYKNEREPSSLTISSTHAAGFVKGIFPVADSNNFYKEEPYNTFYCPVIDILEKDEFSNGSNTKYNAILGTLETSGPSEVCVMLHHLATLRNALATCGLGPDPLTLIYGWGHDVHNEQISINHKPTILGNGFASQDGRVGFGNTLAFRGQRTFAHEVMHMLGIDHPEKSGDEEFEPGLHSSGWDTTNFLSNGSERWIDNKAGPQFKPFQDTFDISIPGKNTKDAWISVDTYNQLLENLTLNSNELLYQDCLSEFFVDKPSISPLSSPLLDELTDISQLNSSRSVPTEIKEVLALSTQAQIVSIKQGKVWIVTDAKKPFSSLDVNTDATNDFYNNQNALYILKHVQDTSELKVIQAKEPSPTVGIQFCVAKADSGDYTAIPFPAIIWPWSLQQPTSETLPTDKTFNVRIGTRSTEDDEVKYITTERGYDARIGTDDPENDLIYGFFSAEVPVNEINSITQISITGPSGPVPIYDPVTEQYENVLVNQFLNRQFSVEITNPTSTVIEISEEEPSFIIEWEIIDDFAVDNVDDDEFVRDDELFESQIVYSHDGGRIWVPLAVNIPSFLQEVTVDREQLCTTTNLIDNAEDDEIGFGIIRVIVSDGLNNSYDEVYISLTGTTSPYCESGTARDAPTIEFDDDVQAGEEDPDQQEPDLQISPIQ